MRATSDLNRVWLRPIGVTVAAIVLLVAACNGSDPAAQGSTTAADVAATTTTEPSAFCQAISTLDQFRSEPTSDDAARAEQIAQIYESLVDEVPATLRPDFEFVIATLRSEPPPTTDPPTADDGGTATFDGEGYQTGSTPAERVGNYISFACTGIANNPGPQPTDPP